MTKLDFGWTDVRVKDLNSVTPDALARKVAKKGLARREREVYVEEIARQDIFMASAGGRGYQDIFMASAGGRGYISPLDDKIYRVSIFPDGVDVICLGLDNVDSTLEGHYDHVDDLPNWVQERLAVLSMMSASPPTNMIEGIGRRISKHVYWVFTPGKV